VSDLTINISRLSEGAHQYDFDAEPKDLELDTRFTDRVIIHVLLEKTGSQMHLRADLRTNGRFECDRCLDDFQSSLSTHYEIVYLTEDGSGHDTTESEVQYLSPDATTIDLGDDVRQFLLLAVPQKLLCNDDCLGLCPSCGVNKNKVSCRCGEKSADPRWEVLKKLSLN